VTVQWGILSTARINEKFVAGCAESEIVQISAVASRDAARARAYAERHGIARAHGSYDALLADPLVEAVYIPLPNALHLEWATATLRAGKHVLCEKPLARDPAPVAEAFALAEREGRLLMEGFMYRHHPQTRKLTELVSTGAVGRPQLIRSAFSFPIASETDVRLDPALAGGALMDVGCYCVSAARLLAGEPVSVTAQARRSAAGVDLVLAGTLRFPGDEVSHFDCGLTLSARDELEVVGDEGSLFLDDPWHCLDPVIEVRAPGRTERLEIPAANAYRLEAENLSAAIRGEAEPLLGRADAIGQAATIAALYRAAESGTEVMIGG
jgi:xylose dehydrogenase (NAD/NADP)